MVSRLSVNAIVCWRRVGGRTGTPGVNLRLLGFGVSNVCMNIPLRAMRSWGVVMGRGCRVERRGSVVKGRTRLKRGSIDLK